MMFEEKIQFGFDGAGLELQCQIQFYLRHIF